MLINGLKVDGEAIGAGLYAMICERDEAAIVAFGMIPSWAIDTVRPLIRQKVIELAAGQRGCTVDEVTPFINEKAVQKTVQEIEHKVCLGIYSAASRAGKMVV